MTQERDAGVPCPYCDKPISMDPAKDQEHASGECVNEAAKARRFLETQVAKRQLSIRQRREQEREAREAARLVSPAAQASKIAKANHKRLRRGMRNLNLLLQPDGPKWEMPAASPAKASVQETP